MLMQGQGVTWIRNNGTFYVIHGVIINKIKGKRQNMGENEKKEKDEAGLVVEMLSDLKSTVIKKLWITIWVLVVILFSVVIYHEYQWSQFETVVIDSGDGEVAAKLFHLTVVVFLYLLACRRIAACKFKLLDVFLPQNIHRFQEAVV